MYIMCTHRVLNFIYPDPSLSRPLLKMQWQLLMAPLPCCSYVNLQLSYGQSKWLRHSKSLIDYFFDWYAHVEQLHCKGC